ncbi:hypothetical protein DSO57_1006512 [Entomophthora muscae]|uniref:Uncharacterized protein n=1 Tax=Entomophthora muscae TaxID=34485 RepID=A0ACC2S9R3_9FUNG|nr:hypothetical protein DSO57_1006512 [Entomophthora muscae]
MAKFPDTYQSYWLSNLTWIHGSYPSPLSKEHPHWPTKPLGDGFLPAISIGRVVLRGSPAISIHQHQPAPCNQTMLTTWRGSSPVPINSLFESTVKVSLAPGFPNFQAWPLGGLIPGVMEAVAAHKAWPRPGGECHQDTNQGVLRHPTCEGS